ncbi:RNA polymerase sigma-70 factor, ECF subfamily [Pedobacter sp. ok626]|uniref:RNA polymerase sigma factor n=1 Tax=Pedobacter sp. ok626 TaxID=1761882 RepID=UPI000891AC4C|nr:RNA polymerase sigma-70 factor [Pedobacter sp. ok626]SDL35255.1 RNA polymerase sigma-70 factor, ECF subfamily [Pedobacter sp. ok626]
MHINKKPNEKELLEAIANGNEIAFKTIYDAYFKKLSAYLYKLCKSNDATEEMVNDVFLKIWKNKSSLNHIESFEAYLFTMARNKAIDYLRKLAKDTNLITELTAQIQESHNEIEERLDATALKNLIEQSLAQLSDQKRKIFKMSKEEGYSYDEIAEEMQLSKSTIKNHLSETLKHLKKQVDPKSGRSFLLLVMLINLLD